MFSVVHSSLIKLLETNAENLPHVLRWMDYIQHKVDFGGLFQKILLDEPEFTPSIAKPVGAVEVDERQVRL